MGATAVHRERAACLKKRLLEIVVRRGTLPRSPYLSRVGLPFIIKWSDEFRNCVGALECEFALCCACDYAKMPDFCSAGSAFSCSPSWGEGMAAHPILRPIRGWLTQLKYKVH